MCAAISYSCPCYEFMHRWNVYLPGADLVTGGNAFQKKKQKKAKWKDKHTNGQKSITEKRSVKVNGRMNR